MGKLRSKCITNHNANPEGVTGFCYTIISSFLLLATFSYMKFAHATNY